LHAWLDVFPEMKSMITLHLALRLISSGFTKVYALTGGWKEWFRSGCPVEGKQEESLSNTIEIRRT